MTALAMEFTFNSDARFPSVGVLPTLAKVLNLADNKNYLTMSYRRRIVPGTLTYTLQSSPALSGWTDISAGNLQQIGGALPTGDGITEVVTFRILPSIEDTLPARLIHLKVSE